MVFTNRGKSGTALLWSVSGNRPDQLALGTGSAAIAITRTGLVTFDKSTNFTTTDISVVNEVTFTSDFSASTMSGTSLTEMGIITSGTSYDLWNVEGFAAIAFDGSNELQVQVTFQTY